VTAFLTPKQHDGCWVNIGGLQCQQRARDGSITCRFHERLEDDAREALLTTAKKLARACRRITGQESR
jgi:hypothetical protein